MAIWATEIDLGEILKNSPAGGYTYRIGLRIRETGAHLIHDRYIDRYRLLWNLASICMDPGRALMQGPSWTSPGRVYYVHMPRGDWVPSPIYMIFSALTWSLPNGTSPLSMPKVGELFG